MPRYALILTISLAAITPFTSLGNSFSRAIGAEVVSALPTLGSTRQAGIGSAGNLARHASRVARFRRATSQLSNLDFGGALAAGELDAAFRLARKVEDPQSRTQNFIAVAKKAGADSELWEAVENSSREIGDTTERIQSARLIAAARNELDMLQTELAIAQQAGEPADTLRHVMRIAAVEGPNSATWDLAPTLIQQIQDPAQRAQSFIQLGQARGDVSLHLKDAIDASSKIADPTQRSQQFQGLIGHIESDVELFSRVRQASSELEIADRTPLLEALLNREQQLANAGAQSNSAGASSIHHEMLETTKLLEPGRSSALLLQYAQNAQDVDSPFWEAAYKAGLRIQDGTQRETFLRSHAQVDYGVLQPQIEESVLAVRRADTNEIGALDPDTVAAAFSPNLWPPVEDAELRTQMWRSASAVAQYFVEESASHSLWKEAAESLRAIEDGATVATDELDDLVTALFGLDAHGSTPGALFAAIDSWGRTPASEQLLRRLVEDGNPRAQGRALELALHPTDTTPEGAQAWLTFLAQHGVVDANLPQAMTTPGSAHIVRRLYNDLGVQPDSQSLQHVLTRAQQQGIDPQTATPRQLDGAIDELLTSLRQLDELDSKTLLTTLTSDQNLASTYFMLNGGRTHYPQTPNADFNTFWSVLQAQLQAENQVDLGAFKPSAIANQDWHEALEARRRPSDDLVWESTVGIPSIDQTPGLINRALGDELAWLLDGGATSDNFAPVDGVARHDKLAGLLEELGDPAHQHTLNDFEALQKRVVQRLRQMRKAAGDAGDGELKVQWSQIIDLVEADDASPVASAQHIPALLLKDPQLSLAPSKAMTEWSRHIDDIAEGLASRGATGAGKQYTIRYLDGVEDFVEKTRFADAVACCFTGATAQVKDKARVARDPHWFVLQIENSPKDAARREATGFVFGTYGFFDNEPAVILNGIYNSDADPATISHILNEIEIRLAKPAGAKFVVTGNRHVPNGINGGYSQHNLGPAWQSAGGHTVERPRAMVENGQPQTRTYDDFGAVVNQPENIAANDANRVFREVR